MIRPVATGVFLVRHQLCSLGRRRTPTMARPRPRPDVFVEVPQPHLLVPPAGECYPGAWCGCDRRSAEAVACRGMSGAAHSVPAAILAEPIDWSFSGSKCECQIRGSELGAQRPWRSVDLTRRLHWSVLDSLVTSPSDDFSFHGPWLVFSVRLAVAKPACSAHGKLSTRARHAAYQKPAAAWRESAFLHCCFLRCHVKESLVASLETRLLLLLLRLSSSEV